jgi:hypothetical protein
LIVPIRTVDSAPRNVRILVETSGASGVRSVFEVFLNGRNLGQVTIRANAAAAFGAPGRSTAPVSLERGLNAIMLRAVQGRSEIRRIRVAAAD